VSDEPGKVLARGTEIVMERIDGPTMIDAISRRPSARSAGF
jgi:hypothetical protein